MSEEHRYSKCFSGVAAGYGKACSAERQCWNSYIKKKTLYYFKFKINSCNMLKIRCSQNNCTIKMVVIHLNVSVQWQ